MEPLNPGNPGDLGGKGFKPPKRSLKPWEKAVVVGGGTSLVLNNIFGYADRAPTNTNVQLDSKDRQQAVSPNQRETQNPQAVGTPSAGILRSRNDNFNSNQLNTNSGSNTDKAASQKDYMPTWGPGSRSGRSSPPL